MTNSSTAAHRRELAKLFLIGLFAPFAIAIFIAVILPALLLIVIALLFFSPGRLRNTFLHFNFQAPGEKHGASAFGMDHRNQDRTSPSGTAPEDAEIDVECKLLDSVEIGPDEQKK